AFIFFEDPKDHPIERNLSGTLMEYFYLKGSMNVKTNSQEVLNGCLLSGKLRLIYKQKTYELQQFDFFFIPPEKDVFFEAYSQFSDQCKFCLYRYKTDQKVSFNLEIEHYNPKKFISRGKFGSKGEITTYRTVWTAIKNKFFMSGFTNIPNESLKRGVITSVNLEQDEEGNIEIYSHIHPEYPEVYIMCIDDKKYGITQYLVNQQGDSICRDLSDGDGVFFPGNLGHSNFAKPFYKKLNYVMYMWIIPTFGKTEIVTPTTLRI
ncbi:MAG: hypothetical protein ACFFGP_12125, partial [Promethearchaeota archaeon]